jgi:hypothetical protein
MVTMTDEKPKVIPRIPISEAYRMGRDARRLGIDYLTGNPYPRDEVIARLDWFIGHDDEDLGIPEEMRAEPVGSQF